MTRLVRADCVDFLRTLDANSVDSVVCDPPYGLEFMGKEWDRLSVEDERTDTRGVVDPLAWGGTQDSPNGGNAYSRSRIRTNAVSYGGDPAAVGRQMQAWHAAWLTECLRVLKPGGHLLAFGGTRTFHRLVCAAEDAGFEARDTLAWVYGSGFPKALDVSKALDAAVGAVRETGPVDPVRAGRLVNQQADYVTDTGWSAGSRTVTRDPPATDLARKYHDWKTALKPAHEPILLARKPLDGTVAANVMAWGVGGLNIGGCRTSLDDVPDPSKHVQRQQSNRITWEGGEHSGFSADHVQPTYNTDGRYPTNLLLDREAAQALDAQVGPRTSGKVTREYEPTLEKSQSMGAKRRKLSPDTVYSDSGGVSRYFPVFDFDTTDEAHAVDVLRLFYHGKVTRKERNSAGENNHPTLKPVALMAWLCRLVTPPDGVVLDPFMGSGSCGIAAVQEGFHYVGVERDAAYFEIAQRRVLKALRERT